MKQAISAVLRPGHSCHLIHHSLQPEHCRYGPNVFSPAIVFRSGQFASARAEARNFRVGHIRGRIRTLHLLSPLLVQRTELP